jgi:hypothetical protein
MAGAGPLTHFTEGAGVDEPTHQQRTCEGCGQGLGTNQRQRGTCARCRLFSGAAASRYGCIVWTGGIDAYGYGKLRANKRTWLAHRLAYELMVGPIPNGLQLDHLCHTQDAACPGGLDCAHRRCINPHHLEPVTRRTNILRGRGLSAANAAKTHCPRGHEYTVANTRIDKNGKRNCRSCRAYHELAARGANSDLPKCGAATRRGKVCDRLAGHEGGHHPGTADVEAPLAGAR